MVLGVDESAPGAKQRGEEDSEAIMNVYVVIQYDLDRFTKEILSQENSSSVVCTALYEFEEQDLTKLQAAKTIFFIVSKTSICSTAYQILIDNTYRLIQTKVCRVIKLDEIEIPNGFHFLRSLPEEQR
jgi:hypothetical protein